MPPRVGYAALRLAFVAALVGLKSWSVSAADPQQPLLLAEGGRVRLKVVVSATATAAVQKHALDLATVLGKMSGTTFDVVAGDGREGIAVGTGADFPLAPARGRLDPTDVMRGDEYFLKTHPQGAWLVGATETAVGHAVWDFLYRLGYRQYFPGSTWEIVPKRERLEVSLDVFGAPSYLTRSIWHQWGTFNTDDFKDWRVRNRMVSHFVLENGHMSHTLEWTNKQAFADHPEYFPLVNGERTQRGGKLCLSNPGLRKLVAEEIIRRFEKKPEAASLSIEPSDGGGWCECEACARLGSRSDQQVTLANEVAAAVEVRFGANKYLGMLAYFQHAAAPSIKVHPQVIVTAATRFGAAPVEETLAAWKLQGARLGVYDYYSVIDWHWDRPGFGMGAMPDAIAKTIPAWHRLGARFFSAESGENWGPKGLGYFLASRLLWDVSEAGDAKTIRSEFLRLCFKDAARPMEEFYALIDGANQALQLDDLVGQMYRRLDAARQMESAPAVQARIDELVAYTRSVELYKRYAALKKAKAPRQAEFDELLYYVFRIRGTGMVHTVALAQVLAGAEKDLVVPAAAKISGSKAPDLWQNSAPPLTRDEITKILADGIAANPVLPFEAVFYSVDLVPAAKRLRLPSVPVSEYGMHGDGLFWHAWIEPGAAKLTVSGAGNFRFKLYAVDQKAGDVLVSEAAVATPPVAGKKHGPPQDVVLASPQSGLHRVVVSGNDSWQLQHRAAEAGSCHSLPSTSNLVFSKGLYFYVPKDTRVVAGKTAGSAGVMKDAAGTVVFEFSSLKERIASPTGGSAYFNVAVAPGQDGTLWKIEGLNPGPCLLYTVPPYFARSAEELLLPREVVDRDYKD